MSTRRPLRFLLLQVITPHYHQDIAIKNMSELEQLVGTFGGQVIEKSIQHRVKPHPATYIGAGKLEWLKATVKAKKINVVVLNAIVNAGQLFRLERALWEVNTEIAVWDRVDLILNIFDKHAQSTEAKLQIELARLEHTGPRIYGLGKTELSRQGGGIGTRGRGETNIEIERRTIKRRQQKIKQQLADSAKQQQQRMADRQQRGVRTAALVGYTSAGKTTLFNALTAKQKATHRGLFTTLDSVVGKLTGITTDRQILISDTIGFIDELPPLLIETFKSTLLESLGAQVLVHVVDAADPKLEEKIEVVEGILHDLQLSQQPMLVFNKVDQLGMADRSALATGYSERKPFFVSAKTGEGLGALKIAITQTMQAKEASVVMSRD